MNKLYVITFLSLFAYVGIGFGMDYDSNALDRDHTRVRAEIAVRQANKALFMVFPASDYINYLINLETIAIANLEAQRADIDTAKAQVAAEQHAVMMQGQQNRAQMQQKRADLQSTLKSTKAALYGLEFMRTESNPEIANAIAQCKIEIVDLESQIKQIDDVLALFA